METNPIELIYDELYTHIQKIKQNKITGEVISNKPSGANSYLTIKNGESQISCIAWSKSFPDIKNGSNVEIIGSVKIMKKNLSIYFQINTIKVLGEGDYLNAHAELRKKIMDLGWNLNKKQIHQFPNNIGIVTSLEGAAIQDILQTFKLDGYIGDITIVNAVVQGSKCPQSVISGIEYFEQNYKNIDLVLITRGGGSYDDLVGFSDWNLITRIHNAQIITISAVGHQIDNQLSDEVADYKFATPSIAAKFIVETQQTYLHKKNNITSVIENYRNQIDICKTELDYININYDSIILDYENIEMENKLHKFKYFTQNIINNWNKTKSAFYNKLSTIKPTIYKNTEVTSICDFVNPNNDIQTNPKKIEIIFPDGSIIMYYKIISYQHVK